MCLLVCVLVFVCGCAGVSLSVLVGLCVYVQSGVYSVYSVCVSYKEMKSRLSVLLLYPQSCYC